jgi:hypothetical protein
MQRIQRFVRFTGITGHNEDFPHPILLPRLSRPRSVARCWRIPSRNCLGSHTGINGIPWFAVIDGSGEVLATSEAPMSNIGFPATSAEVAYFFSVLRNTAKVMTQNEMGTIRKARSKNAAKQSSGLPQAATQRLRYSTLAAISSEIALAGRGYVGKSARGLDRMADGDVAALQAGVAGPAHFQDFVRDAAGKVSGQRNHGSRLDGIGGADHFFSEDRSKEMVEYLFDLRLAINGQVTQDLRGIPTKDHVIAIEQVGKKSNRGYRAAACAG